MAVPDAQAEGDPVADGGPVAIGVGIRVRVRVRSTKHGAAGTVVVAVNPVGARV